MAGSGTSPLLDCQDADALMRAIEAEQASEVATYCATPSRGGVKTADDPMGHFFTIAIVNPGSVTWGSLPVGLRNYSSNRADVV